MNNGKKWFSYVKSYGLITVACAIYALSFNFFYQPNDIAFGGITGIAQMINRLVGFPPVGVSIIVMNIPLFALAWWLLGGKMLLGSLYAMTVSSLLLDLFGQLGTFPTLKEPLMACIFGGAVMGTAAGIIAREGSSMGGTDIASRLLRLKFPSLSIGQVLRVLDLVVIAGVSLVFQQLNSALMGVLALFISTYCMDRVLFGAELSKVAYIISSKPQEIAKVIVTEMHRGVTVLHGEGAWSGTEKQVLMCAFRNRQVVVLKRRIKEIDPYAFLIVSNAYEVLGEGFLPHDPKNKKQPKTPPLKTGEGEPVPVIPFWERPAGVSAPPEPIREPVTEMPAPPEPIREPAPEMPVPPEPLSEQSPADLVPAELTSEEIV
ncbi:MAG: hypothetical protein H6Q61_38 [Firmicutes bacterium]|nr:hypothetical protein [Bacillota bacterium]